MVNNQGRIENPAMGSRRGPFSRLALGELEPPLVSLRARRALGLAYLPKSYNCVAHIFSFGSTPRSELVAAARLNRLAGHPMAFVGSQERHHGGDFRRLAKAPQRDFGLDRLHEFGILAERGVRVRPRIAWRYGICGDSARPQL